MTRNTMTRTSMARSRPRSIRRSHAINRRRRWLRPLEERPAEDEELLFFFAGMGIAKEMSAINAVPPSCSPPMMAATSGERRKWNTSRADWSDKTTITERIYLTNQKGRSLPESPAAGAGAVATEAAGAAGATGAAGAAGADVTSRCTRHARMSLYQRPLYSRASMSNET